MSDTPEYILDIDSPKKWRNQKPQDESVLDSFTRIPEEVSEEVRLEIERITRVVIHQEVGKISFYVFTTSREWIAQSFSDDGNHFETYLLSEDPNFEPPGHDVPYFRTCPQVRSIAIRICKDYIFGNVRRDHFCEAWQKFCRSGFKSE